MRDRQYGSEMLQRACRIGETFDALEATDLNMRPFRLQAGAARLAWYRIGLSSVRIRLTDTPPGRMITQHLAIQDDGRFRFRDAQGVLRLPDEFSDYIRGRHRQAVRTNIAHAHKANLHVTSCTISEWAPGPDDTRAAYISPGPIERWMVLDHAGAVVADSIITVDDDVALLHGLVSTRSHARWMLHTAVVQRLCGRCDVLLTNSDDAYLLDTGTHHFQRLLGYRIARLKLDRAPLAGPSVLATIERLSRLRRRPIADWR